MAKTTQKKVPGLNKMPATKITVVTDFDIEGLHYYKDAPGEVRFLQNPHRHLFRIRVHYKVAKYNREKEIFMQEAGLKEYLHEAYGIPCQFNNMSCENIAHDMLEFSREDGAYKVEVYEDGRGGAIVEI